MRDPSPAATVTPVVWSSTATIRHFGGDETLVRELVALFLKSCPRLMEGLRVRMRQKDLPAVAKAAHALKGSLSNFTPDAPTTTARELEQLCGDGRVDVVERAHERLEREVSRMLAEMRAFQKGAA
jgi:HPt (histidine-containing phosphotransfer) domain-containing protein